jgi:hypothetical protein
VQASPTINLVAITLNSVVGDAEFIPMTIGAKHQQRRNEVANEK